MPTASERVYRDLLDAATNEERQNLEGQLVAICITACRLRRFTPPYEWQPHPQHESLKGRWVGGPFFLASWVRGWVSHEISNNEPLKDGARYIGRRCVFALIDEIRLHERQKRGAKTRNRCIDDPSEDERQRAAILRGLAEIGLPGRLPLEKDRALLKRFIAAYPDKLSNVSIALALGLSEGAIRKRRKRISEMCFGMARGNYQLCSDLKQIGLR